MARAVFSMTFDLSELEDDDLELLMMQLVFGRHALREHDANRAPKYWYEKFQENIDKVTAELESRDEEQYHQAFVGATKFLTSPNFDFEAVRRNIVHTYDIGKLSTEEVADLQTRTWRQFLETASTVDPDSEPDAEEVESQVERQDVIKQCAKILSRRDFDYEAHKDALSEVIGEYRERDDSL